MCSHNQVLDSPENLFGSPLIAFAKSNRGSPIRVSRFAVLLQRSRERVELNLSPAAWQPNDASHRHFPICSVSSIDFSLQPLRRR
jgi:hypothetical protein